MTTEKNELALAESELIEALAESFSIAVESLDAETIVRCIKAALADDKKHYETIFNKYNAIEDSLTLD